MSSAHCPHTPLHTWVDEDRYVSKLRKKPLWCKLAEFPTQSRDGQQASRSGLYSYSTLAIHIVEMFLTFQVMLVPCLTLGTLKRDHSENTQRTLNTRFIGRAHTRRDIPIFITIR